MANDDDVQPSSDDIATPLGQPSTPAELARARKLREAERRRRAVEMRLSGRTMDEIGEALGISHQAVSRLLKRALDRADREQAEQIGAYRALQHARLDRVYGEAFRAWTASKVNDQGDPRYLSGTLAALEAERKLLRLDGTVDVRVDASPITWAEAARTLAKAGLAGEESR